MEIKTQQLDFVPEYDPKYIADCLDEEQDYTTDGRVIGLLSAASARIRYFEGLKKEFGLSFDIKLGFFFLAGELVGVAADRGFPSIPQIPPVILFGIGLVLTIVCYHQIYKAVKKLR